MRRRDLIFLIVLALLYGGYEAYERFVRCPDIQEPVYGLYKSDSPKLIININFVEQTPFGPTKVNLRHFDITDKEGKYFVHFLLSGKTEDGIPNNVDYVEIENVEVSSSIPGKEYKSIERVNEPYPIRFDKDSSDGGNISSLLRIAHAKGEKVTVKVSTRYKFRGAAEEKTFVIEQEWHPDYLIRNLCIL